MAERTGRAKVTDFGSLEIAYIQLPWAPNTKSARNLNSKGTVRALTEFAGMIHVPSDVGLCSLGTIIAMRDIVAQIHEASNAEPQC